MAAVVDVAAVSARVSDKTSWTFVRLTTESGRVGWGEATLQDGTAAVHAHVQALARQVVGVTLSRSIDALNRFGIRGDDMAMAAALSAIDQALWDLTAQERGE